MRAFIHIVHDYGITLRRFPCMQTAAHTYIQESRFATPQSRKAFRLPPPPPPPADDTEDLGDGRGPVMPFHATLIFGFSGQRPTVCVLSGTEVGTSRTG